MQSNGPLPTQSRQSGNSGTGALAHATDIGSAPPRIQSAFGAWGLIMSQDWSIAAWRQPILDEIKAHYTFSEDTRSKVAQNVGDLIDYLTSRRIVRLDAITDDIVRDWVEASGLHPKSGVVSDPAASTRRNRRRAAEVALIAAALLGAPIDPFALVRSALMIDGGGRKTRLLSDAQYEAVLTHADPGPRPSRRSVVVAVSDSGAKPAEAAVVCLADIDLSAGTVALGPPDNRRVNPMSTWAVETIERWIGQRPPASAHESLCVKPSTAPEGAPSSVRTQLSDVMRQAGLMHINGISGASIRYTAARKVFEKHGIGAAARFMGAGTLDTAAAAVGWDWKTP